MTDLQAVIEHLARVDCFDIEPVTLTLASQTYGAVRYQQTCETPEGSRAHREGQREYTRGGFYVLGALPASYRRSTKVAYRLDDSGTDYYVASYYQQPEPNEWHPSGAMWLLFPWDVQPAIDHYEARPYRRLQGCAA